MQTALFSRRVRRFICAVMLLFSLGLRLWLLPAASPAETEPEVTVTEPEGIPVMVPIPAETEAPTPAQAAPQFTAADADAIVLGGNCGYTVDKQTLLQAPLPFSAADAPQVLIVHTHSSEAYTPTDAYAYEPSAAYRTLDQSRSVIAVGDALEAALVARDIGVVHDRSCHDYPDYNASYADAKQSIEALLAEHPSVVLVLDLHRDAADPPAREAVTVNGTDCARLMLVVGTDEGGLYHPFWQDNLSVALKLHVLLERNTPGLCRTMQLRKERFNGQTSPGAFIVEVGSTGNTLEEALHSMPYLADAISELLSLTNLP